MALYYLMLTLKESVFRLKYITIIPCYPFLFALVTMFVLLSIGRILVMSLIKG